MSTRFYKDSEVTVLIEVMKEIERLSQDAQSRSRCKKTLEKFFNFEPVSVPEFGPWPPVGFSSDVGAARWENERIRKLMEGRK